MSDHTIEIVTLREHPHFLETVSDRIWKAWWRDDGYPFDQIDERVRQSLRSETIPVSLVAAIGERFLGTASVITNDLDERPDYTPWVAALWVEPEHRRQGIGAALLKAAATKAFEARISTVYLCATPANAPFYVSRGWRQIEENVAGLNILSLSK